MISTFNNCFVKPNGKLLKITGNTVRGDGLANRFARFKSTSHYDQWKTALIAGFLYAAELERIVKLSDGRFK